MGRERSWDHTCRPAIDTRMAPVVGIPVIAPVDAVIVPVPAEIEPRAADGEAKVPVDVAAGSIDQGRIVCGDVKFVGLGAGRISMSPLSATTCSLLVGGQRIGLLGLGAKSLGTGIHHILLLIREGGAEGVRPVRLRGEHAQHAWEMHQAAFTEGSHG